MKADRMHHSPHHEPVSVAEPRSKVPPNGDQGSPGRTTRGSLPAAILVGCGVVLVLAILAATIVAVAGMRSRAIAETERELRNVDATLAEQTTQSFRAIELIKDAVAQYMRAAGVRQPGDMGRLLSGRDVHTMLANWIGGLPHIEAIMIADATGRVVSASRHWPVADIDIAERGLFKDLEDNPDARIVIGEPVESLTAGTWSVDLAWRYTSPDGAFLGLVLSSVRLEYFKEQFRTVTLGDASAIALFRDDGMLLGRHPEIGWVGKQYSQVPRGITSDRSLSIRLTSEIDGEDRLVALRRLRGFPGIVAVSLPVRVAVAQAQKDGAVLAAAGTALALAIGALMFLLTRRATWERRRAERERDRTREFLDRVIENVPVRIIVKDARDLHYVLLNKASEVSLGFAPGAGIGKSSRDVFPAAVAAGLEAIDRAVLRDRRIGVTPEQELQMPAGTGRVERTTRVPILDKDGEPVYLLVVAEDLTDRRAMERQLQQAVKMEAVGNLTGGIAHDFNNLLMVMIGNLDLLVEEVADNPTALEKVQLVLESSLNGAELTRQMLAFARRQPLNPRCILINQLIDQTSRLLRRTLGQDIDIELRLAPDLWSVRADDAQLQSSLVNIAINARDAMPGGGTLIIEAENVTIAANGSAAADALRPGDYVVIALSDTGAGMPPEVMARIFEPFFTTKAKGKGTGLGLSMVYGFAKQSNGHINVYSEPGRGTTLKLYLPRDEACGSPLPFISSSSIVPLGAGETILAVDDNKDVLATVARQLTDLGYNVETAGSAFSALRLLEGGLAADLLFSDVVMPGGLNGKDLADEVAQKHPAVKVLLTSGFTGAYLANDATLSSRYHLLNKPYRKNDLARAVRDALNPSAP